MFDGKSPRKVDHLKPKMKALASLQAVHNPSFCMVKADGEFTVLSYERGGLSYTINRYGHSRSDFPALNEVVEALDRTELREAEFLSELFAVDDEGKPLNLPKLIKYSKGQERKLENVHLGIFDLVSVNGKRVTQDYEWKLGELTRWLRTVDGLRLKRAYVLPYIKPRGSEDLKRFWSFWVDKQGYEGVVIRTDNGAIYKVKPILDVDAVIIALNKVDSTGKPTKRWPEEKVSSVRVALMDERGRFVELGDCSVADQRIQRALWSLHSIKVSESEERIFVKPCVICQIRYTSIFEGSLCNILKFTGQYTPQGTRKFAKLRHPRFVRFRPDKKVNPTDLRLEQIANG